MSDRVAYFVGNTSGRDHLPWPTISAAQLSDLGYLRTTGVTLATIMAMAWRVKKWNVAASSANVSGTVTSNPGALTETVSSTFAIPTFNVEVFSGASPATRERQLVSTFRISENIGFRNLQSAGFKGSVSQNVTETTTYDNNSAIPDHETVTVQSGLSVNGLLFGNQDDFEYVMFDGSLFYPRIELAGRLNGFFSTVIFGVVADGTNGSLTVNIGLGTVTFPLKIQMTQIRGAHGALSSTTTGGSIALTMTAVEFWPYANSEGLPVYDSGTGAQINDPFS